MLGFVGDVGLWSGYISALLVVLESRWRNCVAKINSFLGFAVSAKYIEKAFDEESKHKVATRRTPSCFIVTCRTRSLIGRVRDGSQSGVAPSVCSWSWHFRDLSRHQKVSNPDFHPFGFWPCFWRRKRWSTTWDKPSSPWSTRRRGWTRPPRWRRARRPPPWNSSWPTPTGSKTARPSITTIKKYSLIKSSII